MINFKFLAVKIDIASSILKPVISGTVSDSPCRVVLFKTIEVTENKITNTITIAKIFAEIILSS
jgi:hypothetical protein